MKTVQTVILFFLSGILILSCGTNRKRVKEKRDTTITLVNSYSELFLDSTEVSAYISENELEDSLASKIVNFYNRRNYQFAWFTSDGLAEQAQAFWNLHHQYVNYSKDSLQKDQKLHYRMERLINQDTVIHPGGLVAMETELALTHHFFEFTRYAYTGSVDPEELQWHIPRKKIDAVDLLDSLVMNEGKNIVEWEPVNSQYKSMQTAIRKFYEIKEKGGWETIEWKNKKLRQGASDSIIVQVKRRLAISGDFSTGDSSVKFNPELRDAIRRVQKRFGLHPTGTLDVSLIHQLNVPIEQRITQLLINMERMRWMPPNPEGVFIVANIPDYRLSVYDGNKKEMEMDIVVGKAGNKTVIFSDEIKYVVFSPYWNIPSSIVRNEILPAMQKDPSYLSRNNMEQTGYTNGLPVIRQKPGAGNALGRVKFLFPNSYNIYLHDTPAKSLFTRESRAFSHGCIRIAEPRKLAEFLLRNNEEWKAEKIAKAMNAGKEHWVVLDKTVPVALTYITAWVDADNLVNFREDIYGHDKKVAERLFQSAGVALK